MVKHYPLWLPFIGFRTLPMDNDGMPTELADAWWESDFFMVEWFGHGLIIFSTEVRRRNR
jgi:hypothetical protein